MNIVVDGVDKVGRSVESVLRLVKASANSAGGFT